MASNRQHSYSSYIKPPKTDGCKPPRRPPNLSPNQKTDLTPFQPIRTLGCPRWRPRWPRKPYFPTTYIKLHRVYKEFCWLYKDMTLRLSTNQGRKCSFRIAKVGRS
ncbi:hypothetical protein DPMN_058120 [Dreissena polymorpha]|uniref:Uncharacterized protein n=1 Tax=Dreissena polymorpha TaxID=45954 RepID=A0A9D4C1F7_DREPO|nr:hypothetical protein DPMN_058120 [Dreissena polymorpha]